MRIQHCIGVAGHRVKSCVPISSVATDGGLTNIRMYNNPKRNSQLGAKANEPSSGLTSVCPQTNVSNHPEILRVACSQHVETHSHFLLASSELDRF